MAICQSCSGEIAEGAVVCKHCGAQIGVPTRPKGVTVIAVLLFISAALSLFSLPSLNVYNSIILGMRVPVLLTQLHLVIGTILAVYCGVAFLQLKKIGRTVYLYYGTWSILNGLIGIFVMPSIIREMPEMRRLPASALEGTIIGGVIGGLIGIALSGYILYYVIRRKDYFIN